MNKYSEENLLAIVEDYERGIPAFVLAKLYAIDVKQIHILLGRYVLYGVSGLTKRAQRPYTSEFKTKIAKLHLKKHLSLREISVQYCVDRSSILAWSRQARKEGFSSFNKPCTRTRKGIMSRKKRTKPLSRLEVLEQENEYLRAEVALLKKVRSLIRERESQAKKTGR